MERALYDAEDGYYTRNIRAVGGGTGDFATSATLDPDFAEAIAQWILAEMRETGKELRGAGGKWHLIELGGGGGHLTEGILRSLGWNGRRRTRYHVVEISPVLRDLQRQNLRSNVSRVTWHSEISAALEAAEGKAIIFSNEFVDAFPATVVQWEEESRQWWEVKLEGRGGNRFAEVLAPLEAAPGSSVVFDGARWEHRSPDEGSRCEILFSWRDWLHAWAGHCDTASMLTIDYGDTFPQLYFGRHGGTLRGYYQHERVLGPAVYARAGHQDLTVDVNFTDLQHWGEEAGWETTRFDSQRDFLNEFVPVSGDRNRGSVTSFLSDPAGAGEAFRVLAQRKGMGTLD